MKVRELIDNLKSLPGDLDVLIDHAWVGDVDIDEEGYSDVVGAGVADVERSRGGPSHDVAMLSVGSYDDAPAQKQGS